MIRQAKLGGSAQRKPSWQLYGHGCCLSLPKSVSCGIGRQEKQTHRSELPSGSIIGSQNMISDRESEVVARPYWSLANGREGM